MLTVVIEHGETSMWKILSAGAPTTTLAADLMVPLWVMTATRCPGYSAAIWLRAASTRKATLSYDSPCGGAKPVDEIQDW